MKPIPFKCPYGDHKAYYYGGDLGNFAGCPLHGQLLYTDIPRDIIVRKRRGWKTIGDVIEENEFSERIKELLGKAFLLLIVSLITLLIIWLLDIHGILDWMIRL